MGQPKSCLAVHVMGFGTIAFIPDPNEDPRYRDVPGGSVFSPEEALARVAYALGTTVGDVTRAMEEEHRVRTA
jgi:hypothetical protein